MENTSQLSDFELVRKAKEGSQEAFTLLVSRYRPQVARTIIGMLGPTDVAEDVGQETFIRFYKALHSFRGEAQLGTYLTRIAINLALNEIKRQKRRQILSLFHSGGEHLQIDFPDQHADPERQDTQALVQHALGLLDPKFRAVAILRLIEGYSTKETGEILSLPKGTVLSRLSRAQTRLKEILTPLLEEGNYKRQKNQEI